MLTFLAQEKYTGISSYIKRSSYTKRLIVIQGDCIEIVNIKS